VDEPRPITHRPAMRRWAIAAIKLLIVAVLLWLVRGQIVKTWNDYRSNPRPLSPHWAALSGGLYITALLPEGLFWLWALRAMGQEVGWFETLRAYYVGHLGKYAPGKAMAVVIRAAMIHSPRLNTGVVVASIFLETLTMMAVGACIAVPVLAVRFSHNALFLMVAGAMALAAGLPTLPPVFSRLAKLLRVGRSSPQVAEKLAGFDYRTLARGWVAVAVGWIVMGASLWAMLRGLDYPADFARFWYLYTAIVAMAVVVGFAGMTPGGVVWRETVFTVLLGSTLAAPGDALIVAVALRLVWILAEVVTAAVLYGARWVMPSLSTTSRNISCCP